MRPLRRDRDRRTGAERDAPDHDALRRIACRGELVGSSGVEQHPGLGRQPGRTAIAPIGERNEPGSVRDQRAKPRNASCENVAGAMEQKNDGATGCGGTCQVMIFSPSAVTSTTSSAAGKPAASGVVAPPGA